MSTDDKRILIVDDNIEIHNDFKRILQINNNHEKADLLERFLFGSPDNNPTQALLPTLQIDSALQGEDAASLVQKAHTENNPYALAFIDIRMPPGWDGINTIKELWNIDPDIQIVICTAYSDYSWQDMFTELNGSENFLVLKKPFDPMEVRQITISLTKKWEYKRRVKDQVHNLESAVTERTEELKHALKLAEYANNLKNEFLGNMSHELRTPLNAIIGFTELICSGKVQLEKSKEYHNDILASAKYLSQMINDLLDMSKLESGSIGLHPETVDIHTLISEIKDIFRPLLTEKHLHLKCTIDPILVHVVTDPTKLKQVLRHFLSNAIKFTPAEGSIEISARPIGSDMFQIQVTDTGIGIEEKDIEKLFAPFQQLDTSMKKKYTGIGLGLTLARYLIELQGGNVGVKSTPGKGSTFYLTLPLKT